MFFSSDFSFLSIYFILLANIRLTPTTVPLKLNARQNYFVEILNKFVQQETLSFSSMRRSYDIPKAKENYTIYLYLTLYIRMTGVAAAACDGYECVLLFLCITATAVWCERTAYFLFFVFIPFALCYRFDRPFFFSFQFSCSPTLLYILYRLAV